MVAVKQFCKNEKSNKPNTNMKTKNQLELTPNVAARRHFDRIQTKEKTMKTLLSVASLSLLLAAGSATAAPKPEIVLVHGAWEEANIWQAVTPLLRKNGYRVVTVTLNLMH
jgi:hypothetical protein